MIKNKYSIVFLLAALWALVKVPVLLTSIYMIFDPRELYVGTIAKELIEGPAFTLFDYQLRHPVGGSLVFGILAVPFFALFGQSYFSLKLLALSYSGVILIFWYLFLAKHFNKRVAFWGSLFFIFSPPLFSKFSLMSYGKHGETGLFTIAAMFIFFRLFFTQGLRTDFLYAALGLLSGFAMYFDPIFFITLATCFLFWFIFDKKFVLKKGFWLFLLFFFIGFSPWIYYNGSHGFATVCLNDRYPEPALTMSQLFRPNLFAAVLNNFTGLVVNHVPRSSCFADIGRIPGGLIGYAYYTVFILAFFGLAWRNRRLMIGAALGGLKEAFFLAFVVIYLLLMSCIAYAVHVSDHELYNFFGYRRLLPVYPFMFAIMALFLDKLWSSKFKHAARPILFVLLALVPLVSGFIANAGLITAGNFGNHLIYEGYSYYELGAVVGRQAGGDIAKAVALAARVRAPYRPSLYEGIGAYWGYAFYPKKPLGACVSEISAIDQKYLRFALRGVGMSVGAQCNTDMQQAGRDIDRVDAAYRPDMYEGLGEWIAAIGGRRQDASIGMIDAVAPEYRPFCYRGLGTMIGLRFGQNTAFCTGLGRKIDPAYRCYYFEGLADRLGWRCAYYLRGVSPGAFIAQVPENCRLSFIKGLESWKNFLK